MVNAVVVNRHRMFSEDGICSTNDFNTVSEPSVSSNTEDTVNSGVGSEGEFATSADNGIFVANCDRVDNRISVDINHNVINVEAFGQRSEHSHEVVSGGVKSRSSIGSLRCTVDFVCKVNLFGVPLVSEVFHVVVLKVSSQGYITTNANFSFIGSYFNNRLFVYVNFELCAHSSTTVASSHFNRDEERVRTSV